MKVLVVDSQELAGALDAGGTRVEALTGLDSAVERIGAEPQSIALVLARAKDRPCVERRLLDTIAAAGSTAPVLFLKEADAQPAGPPPMCAIEETADGTRLLRCALQQARAHPEDQPALSEAIGTRSLMFSYHAPVRRRGRG